MTFPRVPGLLLASATVAAATWAPASADGLPRCQAGSRPPTHAPTTTPSLRAHNICRARVTLVQPVRHARPLPSSAPKDPGPDEPGGAQRAFGRSGYAHLGATTDGTWSGVLGRLEVRDPAVRSGTFDFTGARFMARRDLPTGGTAWLEAGWAETGWSGDGRQRVYTYDTNHNAWTFYDDYGIREGDKIWIYIEAETDAERPTWVAWLWWGDEWHLLSSQALPLTGSAQIEEYVEVHTDAKDPATYRVPPISIDNVQVKTAPGGDLTYWRDSAVDTTPGAGAGGYCIAWETRYDTWRAGTCPAVPSVS